MSIEISGRERLGNLLVARGLVSREQLEKGLKIQEKESHLFIGEILQEIAGITEDDVVETILLQYNMPFLSLSNYHPDPELLKQISKDFARKNHLFPLEKNGDVISIVTVNPFNNGAIEELEKRFNCRVRCFLGRLPDIREAIEKLYG
ncbi:MAG: hypothetical protein V2A65_00655 [Candidatus Omnitrophota bacterium]